ncbi:alpha-S2-casein-like B isoform 3 precursor [Mus musculus]|uniref:Casein alpha s2-like B n=1 Tax=Mus musculus TaxID=10090 RepID=A0A0G2JDP4_MOUSE|nr:alpha-S2-casein-like B isoform 3 precursor [Mus musculus]|eukprot:NP_001288264.1 alpha-S2-casein-like B isoform 3 precursor [Mus musculus]
MKFIILTCLLAVALAKQRMEQYISSEESMDNSQENFKQNMDVAFFPSQESVEAPMKVSDIISQQQYNQKMMDMSVSAREKTVMTEESKNIQDYMNKMKRYSKITWPQFVKLLHQYQKTMTPWSYYPSTPSQV